MFRFSLHLARAHIPWCTLILSVEKGRWQNLHSSSLKSAALPKFFPFFEVEAHFFLTHGPGQGIDPLLVWETASFCGIFSGIQGFLFSLLGTGMGAEPVLLFTDETEFFFTEDLLLDLMKFFVFSLLLLLGIEIWAESVLLFTDEMEFFFTEDLLLDLMKFFSFSSLLLGTGAVLLLPITSEIELF